MQETRAQSLGWEDTLEKEMATHPSILAWRIPWTEEPGGLPSMESQRVGRDWVTNPFLLSLKKENEEVELSIWLKKFYEKEWLNKTNGRETKVTNMNKTEIVEMQNRKKKKGN